MAPPVVHVESLDDEFALTARLPHWILNLKDSHFLPSEIIYLNSLWTSGFQHVGGGAEGLVGVPCAGEVGPEGCSNAKKAPVGAQA